MRGTARTAYCKRIYPRVADEGFPHPIQALETDRNSTLLPRSDMKRNSKRPYAKHHLYELEQRDSCPHYPRLETRHRRDARTTATGRHPGPYPRHEIRVADIDRQWALSRLGENAPAGAHIRVGVNIGARGSKRWPIEYFLEVVRELDRKGFSVIVFAGPQELDRLTEMNGARPDSIVVHTTSEPRRFAALQQTCSLFVT